MKKVTMKYENTYNGKTDTYKKEIDLEFQAGNAQSSENIQHYNMLTSLSLAYIDFLFKLGYSPDLVSTAISQSAKEISNLEEEPTFEEDAIPEEDIEIDLSANGLDYETFLEKFEEDEDFKQKLYQVYQLYSSNDD